MRDQSHSIINEDIAIISDSPLEWRRFSGKNVLITGAAGFLPAYMVETLLFLNTNKKLNCKIVGLVRNLDKAKRRFFRYATRTDFHLVQGDVSEPFPWSDRFDFVIHAASQASPKYYGLDPVGTMSANILGINHLLIQANKWKSEEFLFFSSGEVYGQVDAGKVPTTEIDYGYIDILNIRSCYAESKRAAETLGICYARQFGVPFKIVRPYHTYGPGMALDDGRVFADLVNDVLQQRDLTLRSDGKAVRSFCYLSDAVRGFFTVLLKGQQSCAYNVGNPAGVLSINDLAELLANHMPGKKRRVQHTENTVKGYIPSPISVNIPDVKLLNALGWQPTYLPKEGFMRTIRHFINSGVGYA